MKLIARWFCILAAATALAWLAGCSTSSGHAEGTVIVTPRTTVLPPGGTLYFTANVPVTWSVLETYGGSITSTGVYTAPSSIGTYHVIATNAADASKRTSVAILVSNDAVRVSGLTAAPMADAYTSTYREGANLVRWPLLSGRVVAYIVYRDTNTFAPVAVFGRSGDRFIDTGSPLAGNAVMETMMVDIEIDPDKGEVTRFSTVPTPETTFTKLRDAELRATDTTLHFACRRVPLAPGDVNGYQIQVAYIDYDLGNLTDPPQHPDRYRLYLGAVSGSTPAVAFTPPPALVSPQQDALPANGLFTCEQVKGALDYVLQVSSDQTFPPSGTVEYPAYPQGLVYAQATVDPAQLFGQFSSQNGGRLFWRMGARRAGFVLPAYYMDPFQTQWVFSPVRYFTLVAPPWPP